MITAINTNGTTAGKTQIDAGAISTENVNISLATDKTIAPTETTGTTTEKTKEETKEKTETASDK